MYFIDGQVFFRVQLFKSWIASVIHPINYYPDWINILAKPICPIHWIAIYQVDSIIHLSNNWAQDNYLLFTSNSKIFFWIIEYACIKIHKNQGPWFERNYIIAKERKLGGHDACHFNHRWKKLHAHHKTDWQRWHCNDVITLALIGRNLMHDSSVDREPRGIGSGIQIPEM